MRKAMMAMLALALILGSVGTVGATTTGKGIVVVMDGQTEVNRETYKFLQRNLRQQGINDTLTASLDPKAIKAGTYKAVVVLSTGISSGIDPVLKAFVDGYSAKNELFVVSLLRGSPSRSIVTSQLTSGSQSVDVVTAASAWSEGSDKATYIQLHQGWITVLADHLKK